MKKELRVLLLGAGRRITLIEKFKAADFDVFCYETEQHTPARMAATILEGKKWDDKEIEKHILDLDKLYDFDLILPLMDKATILLSKMLEKNEYLKEKIPTSRAKANEICLNKKVFETIFNNRDFYPKVKNGFEEENKSRQIILKPIFGNSSKGIKVLSYSEHFWGGADYASTHIEQHYIEEGIEYSIDAYFNRDGKMVDAVPRRRIEVQGGEVSRSITVGREHLGLRELTRQIGEEIGMIGPACFQYIVGADNKPFIMEINARAGGGIVLSIEAGFDIIDLMKREYVEGFQVGQNTYQSVWKEDFGMVRYFKESFYEK